MPEAQWYYAQNRQQFGPVSNEVLHQLAQTGKLSSNDLVRNDGLTEWISARRVPGLFSGSAVAGTPPTLPPGPSPISYGQPQKWRMSTTVIVLIVLACIAALAIPVVLATIAVPSLQRVRITTNEAAARAGCRIYAEAQKLYHMTDRNHDGVLQYAQHLRGSASLQEAGLIQASFAKAEVIAAGPGQGSLPFAGYCFKVLTGQGPNASGGQKSYLVDGRMTLGYALVAYPANYNSTGRKTFVINAAGVIYQKDLGPNTSSIVARMTEFDPDTQWMPAG